MGEGQRSILAVIAALGLAGGLLGALLGVLMIITSLGAGGFAAAIGIGLGVGSLVLGVIAIVPALLLRRAVANLRLLEPDPTPPGVGRRVAWGAATTGVLLCWLAPVVLTTAGGDAVPGPERTLAIVGIGLGIVTAATAYASRDLLGEPLGGLMLGIALLTVVLPLWESSLLLETQIRRTTLEQDRRHFEERFDEILNGPTVAHVAATIGDVGDWRLLSGGISPMLRADTVYDNPERLADLAGQGARFALVAQCSADFDGGQLTGYVSVFGRRGADGSVESQYVEFPLVPCDGELHAAVSEAVTLPDWDAATLAGVTRGDWLLLSAGAVVTTEAARPGSSSPFTDHGERWLAFGAPEPEPAPPIEPLLEETAGQLDPLRAR